MNSYLFGIATSFFILFHITSFTYAEENGYDDNDKHNHDDFKNSNHVFDHKSLLETEPFNIAVAGDWGCKKDAQKTAQNIQHKEPELVIANGDLSYKHSSKCWFEIIQPLQSKITIAMGDHEYSDTMDGVMGIFHQYLKPLNLERTFYSINIYNLHVIFMDPHIDYTPGGFQFQFVVDSLQGAYMDPEIDWIFVVESTPIYTSPAKHPANYTIREIYHPLFDRYGVDLVLSSDNHNYQRTFPLKYNSTEDLTPNNPIIKDRHPNNYFYDQSNNNGVIYLIIGTAGRSLYELNEQAYFVAKQDDKHFGFLNIDINGKTLEGTFFANESELPDYYYIYHQGNIIDHFVISKEAEPSDNKDFTISHS